MTRPTKAMFRVLCVALFATLGDFPQWRLMVRARAAKSGTPDAPTEVSLALTDGQKHFSHSVASNEKTGPFPHNLSETLSSLSSDLHGGLGELRDLADDVELDLSSTHVPKGAEQEIVRVGERYVNEELLRQPTEHAFRLVNGLQAPKDSNTGRIIEEKTLISSFSSSGEKEGPLAGNLSTATSSSPPGTRADLTSLQQLADRLEAYVASIPMPKEIEEEVTRRGKHFVNQLPLPALMKDVLNWFLTPPARTENPSPGPTNEEEQLKSSTSSETDAGPPKGNLSVFSLSSPSDTNAELESLEQLTNRLVSEIASIRMPKEIEGEVIPIAEQFAKEWTVLSWAKEVFSWFSNFPASSVGSSVDPPTDEVNEISSPISSVNKEDHPARKLSEASSSQVSDADVEGERLNKLVEELQNGISALRLPKEVEEEVNRIAKRYVSNLPVELLVSEVLNWFNHHHHPGSKEFNFAPADEEQNISSFVPSNEQVGSLPRNLSVTSPLSDLDSGNGRESPPQRTDELDDNVFMPSVPKEVDEEVTPKAHQPMSEAHMETLIAEVLGWYGSSSTTPTPDHPFERDPLAQDDQPASGTNSAGTARAATVVAPAAHKSAVKQPLSTTAVFSALHLGEDAFVSDAASVQEHAQRVSHIAPSPTQLSEQKKGVDGTEPVINSSTAPMVGMQPAEDAISGAKTEEDFAQLQRLRAHLRTINPLLDLEPPSAPRAFTNRNASGPVTPFPHVSAAHSSLESGKEVSHTDKVSQHKQPETVSKTVEEDNLVSSETADSKADPESVFRHSKHTTIGGLQPQTAGLLLLNQFSKAALQRLDPVSRQKIAAYLGTLPVEQQQNLLYYNALLQFIPQADATKLKQLVEHVHRLRNPQESSSYFSVKTHPVEDAEAAVSLLPTVSVAHDPNPSLRYGAPYTEHSQLTRPNVVNSTVSSRTNNVRLPVSSSSSSTNRSSSSSSAGTNGSGSKYNSVYTSPITSSSSRSFSNVSTIPYSSSSSLNGVYTNSFDTTSSSYSTAYSRPISSSSASTSHYTWPHSTISNKIPTTSTISNTTLPSSRDNYFTPYMHGPFAGVAKPGHARDPIPNSHLDRNAHSSYENSDAAGVMSGGQAPHDISNGPMGGNSQHPFASSKLENMIMIEQAEDDLSTDLQLKNPLHDPERKRHFFPAYILGAQDSLPALPPESQPYSAFRPDTNQAEAPPGSMLPPSSSFNTYMLPSVNASAESSHTSVPPVGSLPTLLRGSHALSEFHADTNQAEAPPGATLPPSSSFNTYMLPSVNASAESSHTSVPPVVSSATMDTIVVEHASDDFSTDLQLKNQIHDPERKRRFFPAFLLDAQGSLPTLPRGSQALSGFHANTNQTEAPPAATLPPPSSFNTYMLPSVNASAESSHTSVPPVRIPTTHIGNSVSYNLQNVQPKQQPHQPQATVSPIQLQQHRAPAEQQVPGVLPQQQRIAALPQLQHQQSVQLSAQPQQHPPYLPRQEHQQQQLPPSKYPQQFVSPQQQQQIPLPQEPQQQYHTSWPSSSNPAIQQQQQQGIAQRPARPINYMRQDEYVEEPYTYSSSPDTSHMQSFTTYPTTFTASAHQQTPLSADMNFYPSQTKYSSSAPEDIRGAAGTQPFQFAQPLLPDLVDLSLRPLLEPITTLPVIQPLVAPLQHLLGTAPTAGADAFRSVPVLSGSNFNNRSSTVLNGEKSTNISTTFPSIIPRETADSLLQPLAEVIRLATKGVVEPTVTHANELLREAHDFNTRVHQGSLQATQFFNDFAAYRTANPDDPLVKLFATLEDTAASLSTNKDEGAAAAAAVQERFSRQLQHPHSAGNKKINTGTEEIASKNKSEGGKKRGNNLRRRKASSNQPEDTEEFLFQGMQLGSVQGAVMQSEPAGYAGNITATGRRNPEASAAYIDTPAEQGSDASMVLSGDRVLNRSSDSSDAPMMNHKEGSNNPNAVVGEVKYNLTSKDDPFDFSSFASSAAARKNKGETSGATSSMIEQQGKNSQQEENIAGKVTNVIGATVDAALDLFARQQQRQALRSQNK